MQIKKQRMGPFGTNCYLVWDQASGEGMLLDPAGRPQRIEEILQGFAGKLKYVVLTHGHADHVAGLGTVKAKTGAPILMHADDAPMLQDNDDVVARYVGIEKALPLPDHCCAAGNNYSWVTCSLPYCILPDILQEASVCSAAGLFR